MPTNQTCNTSACRGQVRPHRTTSLVMVGDCPVIHSMRACDSCQFRSLDSASTDYRERLGCICPDEVDIATIRPAPPGSNGVYRRYGADRMGKLRPQGLRP